MSPLTGGTSYWLDTTPDTAYPALARNEEVDVCIVGGGITGLLTAWELAEAGCSVAVLEQGAIVQAVTGFTTAKVTSQHGLRYSGLERRHGAQAARWYGAAQQRGLERLLALAEQLGAGDVERRDAWVYASRAETVPLVRAEADAARRAGLPARFEVGVPVALETFGGVVFEGQAQVHPRALLLALATRLAQREVIIAEHTKVTDVSASGVLQQVRTDTDHAVLAKHVLLATLLPGLAGQHLRRHIYCHQGYAIAVPVDQDPVPSGMYINADRPMRSLRSIPTKDGKRLLQVGGSAWVADPASGATPWDDLESWAAEQFGAGPAHWRWTTQDYSSADGVPLIGSVEPDGHVHVATGFGGWGLTTAAVAAELVCDVVRGHQRDWHALFAPSRDLPEVDTRIISAHRRGLGTAGDASIEALRAGEAIVTEVGDEEVAAYRDDDGTLHRVSAACTHLGGIVLWDSGRREWQCPCHGSRFAPDGTVTSGPAKDPLPAR